MADRGYMHVRGGGPRSYLAKSYRRIHDREADQARREREWREQQERTRGNAQKGKR